MFKKPEWTRFLYLFSSSSLSFSLMTIVIRVLQSSNKVINTQLKFTNKMIDLELKRSNLKLCKHCH